MTEILVFIIVFFVSYSGVEILRRWSWRRQLFDIPNERSSHSAPTPRGGGLIIVVVCLVFYAIFTIFISENFVSGYFFGAILIALISWLDDIYDISFVWRFVVHSCAAFFVIFSTGYYTGIYLPVFHQTEFGSFGLILTFFWIVWLTNAYNFMDGIDGIAGMQAVTAGIGWLIVGKMLGFETVSFYGGVIAFSSLGFLIHNWQPAKIFMGDVGSAFLGYTFAVLPLLAKNKTDYKTSVLLTIAIGLVFLFVIDTVLTFFRRALKKEKIWQAHRSHLYQRIVLRGYSHQSVTVIYSSISVIIIGMIAYWLKFQR